jgi:hypothetical protein
VVEAKESALTGIVHRATVNALTSLPPPCFHAALNADRRADSNWVISDPFSLIDGVVAPAKCTVQDDPLSSVIVVIMFGLMMD